MVYAMFAIANEYPDQAGLFLDDFSSAYEHRHWRLSEFPEIEEIAWPLKAPGRWERTLQNETEHNARALLGLRSQKLIVNGSSRLSGPRLWESVGRWISLKELAAGAVAGDHVLVKGIAPDRESWISTVRPESGYPPGTSFKDVFSDVYNVCKKLDLVLGLSLEDNPTEGGSSLCTHKFSDPREWETI